MNSEHQQLQGKLINTFCEILKHTLWILSTCLIHVPKILKWEQANPLKTGYFPLYTLLSTQDHVLQQKRN